VNQKSGVREMKKLLLTTSLIVFVALSGCIDNDSKLFITKGDQALKNGKHELATEMYNSALEISPGNAIAKERLHEVEKAVKEKAILKEWQQKVDEATELLAEQSYDKLYDYTKKELMNIGKEKSLSKYRKELEKLQSMALDIVPTYIEKAKEVTESGENDEALRYIRIAEHIKGETSETKKWKTINHLFIQAKEHVDSEEYEGAKSILNEVLALNEDSSEAQFLLDQIITWENNQSVSTLPTTTDPVAAENTTEIENETQFQENSEGVFVQQIRTTYDNFYYDVIQYNETNSKSIQQSQMYSNLREVEKYFSEAHQMNPPTSKTEELKQAWITLIDRQAVFIESLIQMEYERDAITYHGDVVMPAMTEAMDAIDEFEKQLSLFP
jgi:tetratricopeptide (TPR) repeat protein